MRAAVADRTALETRAEVRAGHVEQARRRADALQTDLDKAHADAERRNAELTRRDQLAERHYRDLATTAEQHKAEAEPRHHELLTALATAGYPIASHPGGGPLEAPGEP